MIEVGLWLLTRVSSMIITTELWGWSYTDKLFVILKKKKDFF